MESYSKFVLLKNRLIFYTASLDIEKIIIIIDSIMRSSLKHRRWHQSFLRMISLLGILALFCDLFHTPAISTISTTGDRPGSTTASGNTSGITAAVYLPTALGTASVIQSFRSFKDPNPDDNNSISTNNNRFFLPPHYARSLNGPIIPFRHSDQQKLLRLDIPPPFNLFG